MAALTAASWTLATTKRWRSGGGKIREVTGTLVLAGTDTYPDNGIPLPAKAQFGVSTVLDFEITGVDPTAGTVADYLPVYDRTNHKLFLYEEEATAAGGPLLECDTAEVPGARTYDFHLVGV